ncbi:MAG: N-acetylmuramoyl-L-alanine amidase [Bacteroidetes bacterium]|nr:N-acetylmuramoyl-L-alanine amidase [Bacteroidota bacterium]
MIIFSFTLLPEKNVFPQEKIAITKVVIDAGHGGKDPGTIGKKSQEKNVALQIALKLSDEIRSQCKGVTVICTRTTDEFIELHERAEIANRSKADLFISIHCNANPKHTFQGAETYVMGLHRTEANLEIAKKENAAILMEPDYSVKYNGFDPNSDESYITFTLFQNAFLEQSTRFAAIVQDEMKDRVGMNDRGVRQAGFLVLYKTTMPSVLIETGFLSNPDEEKFLTSQKGQQYIASAICRAFRKFKAKLEGNGKELATLNEIKPVPPPENVVPAVVIKEDPDSGEKPKENISAKDTIRQKVKPKEPVPGKVPVSPNSKSKQPVQHKDTLKSKTNPGANASVAVAGTPKKKSAEKPPAKDSVKSKSKVPVQAVKKDSTTRKAIAAAGTPKPEKSAGKPVTRNPVKTEDVKSPPPKPSNDVVFRVQIATSAKELSIHSKKFEGLQDIWKYQHQGVFKYTTGKESTPEALSGVLGEAKKLGFTDAFIVAFHGEERITVAEGRKLISEGEK